ncbi:hypothetical protein, partial [Amycolatopsis sp. NPDC004079]|uniref:hypothetical protein n=1 Tax=Amycolatopsis sp. NPDC004079 TaxID=3154549 RepID=UPI0033B0917F
GAGQRDRCMADNRELSTQGLIEGVFAGHAFTREIAGRECAVRTIEASRDGDWVVRRGVRDA